MTAKSFFLEDVERECSIFREKERKRCLKKKQGSEGEAKLDMVQSGALNTVMFTYSLVRFESENHIKPK